MGLSQKDIPAQQTQPPRSPSQKSRKGATARWRPIRINSRNGWWDPERGQMPTNSATSRSFMSTGGFARIESAGAASFIWKITSPIISPHHDGAEGATNHPVECLDVLFSLFALEVAWHERTLRVRNVDAADSEILSGRCIRRNCVFHGLRWF